MAKPPGNDANSLTTSRRANVKSEKVLQLKDVELGSAHKSMGQLVRELFWKLRKGPTRETVRRMGDEELQAPTDKLKSFRGKSIKKIYNIDANRKKTVCELENKVWEDVEVQERHEESTQEATGHETNYHESNDHGSIMESSFDKGHEHGARRRKKFLVYNPTM
ncbi:hypothetical protein Gotur_035361 [Gossypium turneri]